jgi:hypothetical protein
MTADIVNLRQARKQKLRAEKATKASENRSLFGRSRAQRDHEDATRTLQEKALSLHRRGDHPASGPKSDD